jgi:hypothetical protein
MESKVVDAVHISVPQGMLPPVPDGYKRTMKLDGDKALEDGSLECWVLIHDEPEAG